MYGANDFPLPLSETERRLLRALVWGEPLPLAAAHLGLTLPQARRHLLRLQSRTRAPTPPALRTRALVHRWML